VCLLVVSKFFVIKAEHTVGKYNGSDFTRKIATLLCGKNVLIAGNFLSKFFTYYRYILVKNIIKKLSEHQINQ
jgi:hypothetical protein